MKKTEGETENGNERYKRVRSFTKNHDKLLVKATEVNEAMDRTGRDDGVCKLSDNVDIREAEKMKHSHALKGGVSKP